MRIRRAYLFMLLAMTGLRNQAAENGQVTITDTGSTNRPGLQVTMGANGNARVVSRGMEPHTIQLNSRLCKRFLASLQTAAPLHDLPAAHCMKSASFGSRLFIEYKGERSPDLSCPVQQDARVDSLKEQALAILKAARPTSALQNR